MKWEKILTLFFALSLCVGILSAMHAQTKSKQKEARLTLAQILTGLQTQGVTVETRTLMARNQYIARRVRERGVTFPLTEAFESELRNAGASDELLKAIRENSPPLPRPTPTPKPAEPDRVALLTRYVENLNGVTLEMILIPAGSFLMGSTEDDIKRVAAANNSVDDQVDRSYFADELPQHRVTISQPFYLGRYEVTQKQWEEVMGTTVQQQRDKANPNYNLSNVGPNQPMYFVSWHEAQEFVRELNQRSNKYVYRLPTEAEWEYACRAGTTGDYAGNLNTLSWCGDNSRREQHNVGMKAPNAWGLYDMHGNVWEWCEDWYGDYASGSQTDPRGAASGHHRVVRGGSWSGNAWDCRSAVRHWVAPGVRTYNYGFRVLAVARTQ